MPSPTRRLSAAQLPQLQVPQHWSDCRLWPDGFDGYGMNSYRAMYGGVKFTDVSEPEFWGFQEGQALYRTYRDYPQQLEAFVALAVPQDRRGRTLQLRGQRATVLGCWRRGIRDGWERARVYYTAKPWQLPIIQLA